MRNNKKLQTVLISTLIPLFLTSCDQFKNAQIINLSNDRVIAVNKDNQGYYALGVKWEYVLSGERKVILSGKAYKLPPGVAFGLFDHTLGKFSVKDFVNKHKQEYPKLSEIAI